MKVKVILTMDVPNEQDLDTIEELIQDWMSEADYVMRNRHFNERRLPNDPVVIDVEQLRMD